jgi:hypothetical protein
MIMSSPKHPSLLHVLSSLMLVAPYLVWVKSTMMTSIKVQSPSLVIRISTHHRVWRRWDLLLNMCSIFQNNSCDSIMKCIVSYYVHSFLKGHWNKWVPKLSIIWPHWHCERWATIGSCNPRQVRNAMRKWVEDKQNENVIGQVHN